MLGSGHHSHAQPCQSCSASQEKPATSKGPIFKHWQEILIKKKKERNSSNKASFLTASARWPVSPSAPLGHPAEGLSGSPEGVNVSRHPAGLTGGARPGGGRSLSSHHARHPGTTVWGTPRRARPRNDWRGAPAHMACKKWSDFRGANGGRGTCILGLNQRSA